MVQENFHRGDHSRGARCWKAGFTAARQAPRRLRPEPALLQELTGSFTHASSDISHSISLSRFSKTTTLRHLPQMAPLTSGGHGKPTFSQVGRGSIRHPLLGTGGTELEQGRGSLSMEQTLGLLQCFTASIPIRCSPPATCTGRRNSTSLPAIYFTRLPLLFLPAHQHYTALLTQNLASAFAILPTLGLPLPLASPLSLTQVAHLRFMAAWLLAARIRWAGGRSCCISRYGRLQLHSYAWHHLLLHLLYLMALMSTFCAPFPSGPGRTTTCLWTYLQRALRSAHVQFTPGTYYRLRDYTHSLRIAVDSTRCCCHATPRYRPLRAPPPLLLFRFKV